MAGAFQSGFSLGQRGYQQALDNERRDRQDERQAKLDARQEELHRLSVEEGAYRLGSLRDDASRRNELAGMRTQMSDTMTGFDRPAFNQNANQDFDAQVMASENAVRNENAFRNAQRSNDAYNDLPGYGAPPPPPSSSFMPPAQSNASYEQGLRARATQAPDITSDPYQRQMAGMRQKYALASGDMAGFDASAAGERKRITDREDAEFAANVIKDPGGEAARSARTFINNQSRSLSVDTDPKTGISTFRIIKGDRTVPIDVGPSDLGKIAVGVRRLQRGDVGGLDVVSAINKDLAAVVLEEFKLEMDVGGKNNDANYKTGSLKKQTAELDLRKQMLEDQRQNNRNVQSRYDAANKQITPEDARKLNDLSVALQTEKDPIKRQKLQGDFTAAQANAFSKIGRVVGLPQQRTPLDVPIDKFMEVFGNQVVGQKGGKPVLLRDSSPEVVRAAYMQFRNPEPAASPFSPEALKATSVALGGNKPAAGRGLPLQTPTLAQLRAMAPEALQMYANSGNQVAKALVREIAQQADAPADPRFQQD